MNAFRGLLWKDFHTSKVWFIGWLAIIIVVYSLGLGAGGYFDEEGIPVGFAIMLGVFHFAFLPVIVYSMLRLEGKTQLWLHTPLSGFTLLSSKLLVAIVYLIISLLLVDLLGFISFSRLPEISYWPVKEGVYFNIGVLLLGLNMSGWLIFFWTVYHSMGKFPAIKNIRWLILAGLWILYTSVTTFVTSLKPVENFVSNTWVVDLPASFFFTIGSGGEDSGFNIDIIPLPLLPFIWEGVMWLILFIISCRLLDRRIEV
ncbi:hypothetical protein RGU11_07250 [Rossellomorea marisflavi]|uniref:hypothetical protein n=1 Tax=Rossellomorea marisflavi TaxID=189381 RepID=UPI0028530EAE|nr:hypothetical protein [Rossellomorea marisflavi]MDR4936162.1 hypothetical protein [Rossellomorea marisflavi]